MSHHRRTHVVLVLVAALALMAAVAAACSAQESSGYPASAPSGSSGGSSSSTGSSAGSESAKSATDDWGRIADALAWMRDTTPTKPVVVLLGGSAARESTISDASWRSQVVTKGGPETIAWNMGSHNRTMAQNLAIVRALPQDAKAVVVVGINLGSFTSTQKTASIKLPSPGPTAAPTLQQPHQYGVKTTGILSVTKKRAAVQQWLSQRYPVFKANFANNAAILAKIIQLCKTRKYTTVLLELPRDSAVIGTALNTPTKKFRDRCKRLAATYHIQWVPLMASLPNADFYDLWHLVEPGRTVWQAKLSVRTAAALK